MKYFYATILGLLMVVLATDLSAQSYWSDSALPARSNQHINPASYRGLHLDIEALQATVETVEVVGGLGALIKKISNDSVTNFGVNH